MFKINPLVAAVSIALLFPSASFAADTGDAPDAYGTATHEVVAGAPQIGDKAPDDNMPFSSVGADEDDNDAIPNDEDGISAFPQLVQNAKSFSVNVFVTNPSATAATLVGWVDFDGSMSFDADEGLTATVPAGADNLKVKLLWPDNFELSTDYFGDTYARFRISSDALTVDDASGNASDGEVEDYKLDILEDSDGDEIPNADDLDNDNDGIPDLIEGIDVDTDNDTIPNYLDTDSDGDSIPDYAEAGPAPNTPQDTDGDGQPDYLDTDLIPDFLDLDSDNDGIPDIYESNTNEINIDVALDADTDGRVDSTVVFGENGYVDDIETEVNSGIPIFAIPDTDEDGVRDFRDTDSDDDGTADVLEAGGKDDDDNGLVDAIIDANQNGVPDGYDIVITGGVDTDSDNIDDAFDMDFATGADQDGDGLLDSVDLDINNDGIVDSVITDKSNDLFLSGQLPDVDGDFNPDFRDDDAIGFAGGTAPIPDTEGETTGVTTDGGATAGGTPTGSTAGNSPASGTVETGLSGNACSITGGKGNDPMFPGLLLLSSIIMFLRRKSLTRLLRGGAFRY